MYFRYTVLFCFLFAVLVGCGQSGDVTAPGSAPKVDDRDTHYEQLLLKRLELQEKIFEAMELYRTTSKVVHEQQTLLRQYLGGQPDSETIELFSKGQVRDIPQNLRVAYSCWQTQIPLRTRQIRIEEWLDGQQVDGRLESYDNAIMSIENRRQLGGFYSQKGLDEFDQLLAQQVVGFKAVDIANRALLEEEVIQQMVSELQNWE